VIVLVLIDILQEDIITRKNLECSVVWLLFIGKWHSSPMSNWW